jgi:membrane-associated protease RseP (regulator of RpoE activity)
VKKFTITPSGLAWAAAVCLFTEESVFAAAAAAIAVHEMGHFLMLRVCGIVPEELSFDGLGFSIKCPGEMSYRNELFAAAAGPAASFLFSALCLAAGKFVLHDVMSLVAGLSFVYGAFNCLPSTPFDGGRVLRCTLMLRMSFAAAGRIIFISDILCYGILCAIAAFALIWSGNYLPALLLCSLLPGRIKNLN